MMNTPTSQPAHALSGYTGAEFKLFMSSSFTILSFIGFDTNDIAVPPTDGRCFPSAFVLKITSFHVVLWLFAYGKVTDFGKYRPSGCMLALFKSESKNMNLYQIGHTNRVKPRPSADDS
jgi:hypothetical protein